MEIKIFFGRQEIYENMLEQVMIKLLSKNFHEI